MSSCAEQFEPLIAAYHDGELDEPRRAVLREHLDHCPHCARQLDELRSLSGLFADDLAAESDTSDELARFHKAIDDETDRPLLRLGLSLAAVAASILIVALAWLSEIPGGPVSGPSNGPSVVVNTPGRWSSEAPDWPSVAITLRVFPHGPWNVGDPASALAQAQLTDWMMEGLSGNPSHEDR